MREFLESSIIQVYRYALRLTRDLHASQDITQEACLRAWRQKGRLRKPGAARVWIFRIATNVWRDHMRSPRSIGQQLCELNTNVLAPLGHAVVLCSTPTDTAESVFVIQVLEEPARKPGK